MERFCGMLQRSLRSRVQPWSNLNRSLLHAIYLEQLGVRYNLQDELRHVRDRIGDGPIGHERVLENCTYPMFRFRKLMLSFLDPDYVFRPPYKAIKHLEHELYTKITKYLAQVLGKRSSEVKCHLSPASVSGYCTGKLRIQNGGDIFRTKHTSQRSGSLERRNYYVRVRTSLT